MLGDRVGLDVYGDCRALTDRLEHERIAARPLIAVEEPTC